VGKAEVEYLDRSVEDTGRNGFTSAADTMSDQLIGSEWKAGSQHRNDDVG